MEKGWHEAQSAHISHLADEMVRLFVSGHLAQQTAEYEAVREQYMQEQVNKAWHDTGFTPPPHTQVG